MQQQQRRRNRIIIRLVAFGLLAGAVLTAHPAQAVDAVGPYYAEPAWDQQIAPATRFVVLTNWNSAAVLDKETGLVWEKTPSITTMSWIDARHHCTHETTTGARKGWRLPAVHELTSLIDPSVASPGPTLPPGHPFTTGAFGVRLAPYWSATTYAAGSSVAWEADFSEGSVSTIFKGLLKPAWCVRGGMNADVY